jgi:16S rRNA (guanine1207-N2)-methyltransferase
MTSSQPYSKLREFEALLDGQPVRVVTKPGFANWKEVTPATYLLAQAARSLPKNADQFAGKPGSAHYQILVLGCGHGALGAVIASQPGVGEVWLADTTITALEMTERTLQGNHITNAHLLKDLLSLPMMQARFDLVFMELPKGRRLTRRWLFEAHLTLKPGGSLFLSGANDEGIQPAIRDGQSMFGNASILSYKKGSRIARLVKDEDPLPIPEWASEPGILPKSWIEFKMQRNGIDLHLCSLPGVFSAGNLDGGTALLLDHLSLSAAARVLDAGCGYGVIGLFAWRLGVRSVDMVDNNLLAIACARENIVRNAGPMISGQDTTIRAFPADALEFIPTHDYTHILSNPPFHAGKAVDTHAAQAFIQQANRFLDPGGQLILVANRFLRYDRLMQDQFGNISRIAETGKYHLLSSVKEGKGFRTRAN